MPFVPEKNTNQIFTLYRVFVDKCLTDEMLIMGNVDLMQLFEGMCEAQDKSWEYSGPDKQQQR